VGRRIGGPSRPVQHRRHLLRGPAPPFDGARVNFSHPPPDRRCLPFMDNGSSIACVRRWPPRVQAPTCPSCRSFCLAASYFASGRGLVLGPPPDGSSAAAYGFARRPIIVYTRIPSVRWGPGHPQSTSSVTVGPMHFVRMPRPPAPRLTSSGKPMIVLLGEARSLRRRARRGGPTHHAARREVDAAINFLHRGHVALYAAAPRRHAGDVGAVSLNGASPRSGRRVPRS